MSPSIPVAHTRWRGVIPSMVTPLRARDQLDLPGLERLVEHMIAGGVHGLLALGGTGEAPGLSYRLRRELISRTCRLVAGRVPVLVGITDTAFVEALELSRFAAECGASALMMAPPYYFPGSQPELLEYLHRLAPELPLPLFLYNMPAHTNIFFELDTLRRAMEEPNIVGIKDCSSNMVYFHGLVRLLSQRPDWSLLMGPEELLGESILFGGHGGVCDGANLFPHLYVDLYEAALAQDVSRVAKLHGRVMQISSMLHPSGQHGSGFVKGLKCALKLSGICDDFLAEPFHRFREADQLLVQTRLLELEALFDPAGRRPLAGLSRRNSVEG